MTDTSRRLVVGGVALALMAMMVARPVMVSVRRMRRPGPPARAMIVPSGELGAPPPRFYFPETDGTALYRVVVTDPHGREVTALQGPASPLVLPEGEGRYFERGVAYAWRVERRDGAGRLLETGPATRFVVR